MPWPWAGKVLWGPPCTFVRLCYDFSLLVLIIFDVYYLVKCVRSGLSQGVQNLPVYHLQRSAKVWPLILSSESWLCCFYFYGSSNKKLLGWSSKPWFSQNQNHMWIPLELILRCYMLWTLICISPRPSLWPCASWLEQLPKASWLHPLTLVPLMHLTPSINLLSRHLSKISGTMSLLGDNYLIFTS